MKRRTSIHISSSIALFMLIHFNGYCQKGFQFPSLSEAMQGFRKEFKVPDLKDFQNYSKDYQNHLKMLDRRSEKAYRKSFIKFIEVEDKLLYTLCDSNEFRAQALMRSSMASYSKLERDRVRYQGNQLPFNFKSESLKSAAKVSHEMIPELDTKVLSDSETTHEKKQERFASRLYSDYMSKRVMLYQKTFQNGTKEQKKLFRKLQKRMALWASYKSSDTDLMSKFSDQHASVLRTVKATPQYGESMSNVLPDYSGTQGESGFDASSISSLPNLLDEMKEQFAGDILTDAELESINSVSDLFQELKEAKEELPDSIKIEQPKEIKLNNTQTKSFWDRLYGGVDFDWQNSTGYYPDGLGITLTGGYKLSDNSGLNTELTTLLNGSEMGFGDDQKFDSKLVSNYTLGANVDTRIWKIIYGGVGVDVIFNQLNAPVETYFDQLDQIEYTYGIPLILKFLIPVSGTGNTNLELRYDLNAKNNIKPTFNFKVGFLIGR